TLAGLLAASALYFMQRSAPAARGEADIQSIHLAKPELVRLPETPPAGNLLSAEPIASGGSQAIAPPRPASTVVTDENPMPALPPNIVLPQTPPVILKDLPVINALPSGAANVPAIPLPDSASASPPVSLPFKLILPNGDRTDGSGLAQGAGTLAPGGAVSVPGNSLLGHKR